MPAGEDFYRDDAKGEFRGDILEPLAALFPAVRDRPPLESRWRLTVRALRDGPVGYLFRAEPDVVCRLKDVFEEVYRGVPRDPRYPGVYNEGHGGGLPLVCLGVAGADRFEVWLRPTAGGEAGVIG